MAKPSRRLRPAARPPLPGRLSALLAGLAAGGALLLAACLPTVPPAGSAGTSVEPIPLQRATRPVPNRITYEIQRMTRNGGEFLVDLDVRNGTGRDFKTLALQIQLIGADGRTGTVRVPVGILSAGGTRRAAVRVPNVNFEVEDLAVAAHVSF